GRKCLFVCLGGNDRESGVGNSLGLLQEVFSVDYQILRIQPSALSRQLPITQD
ncbi:MAG: hypothetical protein F6J98_24865, partial [Moorea sp. SIO4G2]|nr:hypothetical protein [Moorena sp. SIO4G2]